MKRAPLIEASGSIAAPNGYLACYNISSIFLKEVMLMPKVMVFRRKNIPFQKTPTILIQNGKDKSRAEKPYYSWDETKPYLVKIRKDNEDYFPAPWYAYFENGELVKELDFSKFEYTAMDETFSVYEQKGIEVVPYLPKTSDDYYTGNLIDVFFTAERDFDLTIYGDKTYNIASYKQGQNINEVTCNLLKLTYDLYIYRKEGLSSRFQPDDMEVITNEIYQKPQIFGSPSYAMTRDTTYADTMNGYFTADSLASPENYEILWSDGGLLANNGYWNYNSPVVKYPINALLPHYISGEHWNGEQKISRISSQPLWTNLRGIKVAGFKYTYSSSVDSFSYYDNGTWYWYRPIYILRKVEPIKSPITGA